MYPAHGLLEFIAFLSSHCDLIPSLIRHYHAYIAEASPCIAFMLANFIVLAIFLTSNKPPKAPLYRRRPSSSRSKSPKRQPLNNNSEGRSNAAARPTRYGALHLPENPKETLISPSPIHSTELLIQSVENHDAAVGCPKRPICIGDGGLQPAAVPVSPKKPLDLEPGYGGGIDEGGPAESVRTPSHDDLDKRFEQYINSFFARVRAEIEDTRCA